MINKQRPFNNMFYRAPQQGLSVQPDSDTARHALQDYLGHASKRTAEETVAMCRYHSHMAFWAYRDVLTRMYPACLNVYSLLHDIVATSRALTKEETQVLAKLRATRQQSFASVADRRLRDPVAADLVRLGTKDWNVPSFMDFSAWFEYQLHKRPIIESKRDGKEKNPRLSPDDGKV
ncbi:hypothetical protein QFC21_005832 [Naganishia friedmannii]|uniref:Uncharacterized protein n=1 Tax=Naganishia friedmannii TaxID=89922 RepID=A0ACC2V5Q8_9TREE|nr:hypothetical protein QFC21_005832 [Naganishia friedmannii]